MTKLGLDYSAGRIPGRTIKAAGYDFVLRYVDDRAMGLISKHVTATEYQDLIAAGVDVWLVFEVDINDMMAGRAGGIDHAHRARTGADQIGYPPEAPILFACDKNLLPQEIPIALAYLAGAISVLGNPRVGVYGFYELIDAAISVGKGSVFWQCGIHPAATDPVHLYQRNTGTTHVGGVECDINELLLPIPCPAQPGAATSRDPEDTVALIDFPATGLPKDSDGHRWQDTDPSTWPLSGEQKTALAGGGLLASITCGWARGQSRKDALCDPTETGQDGPDANGVLKPSGWIDYIRVFWFADGAAHQDWRVAELYRNVPLLGNKSLPEVPLPAGSTFLVCSYTAPGGLYLGVK